MTVFAKGVYCTACGELINLSEPTTIIHTMCDNTLRLTVEDLEVIKDLTYNQYIHYDNLKAHKLMRSINDFIDESKKDKQ